jgi:hypothetical protein
MYLQVTNSLRVYYMIEEKETKQKKGKTALSLFPAGPTGGDT